MATRDYNVPHHPRLQFLHRLGLKSYWEREEPDCLTGIHFPIRSRDAGGEPLAVALFRQLPRRAGPRVVLCGALGAHDTYNGFRLEPENVIDQGTHDLLDVCLTVEEARRAAWWYQQVYPAWIIEVVADPWCRALLRRPIFHYPMPDEGWLESFERRPTDREEDVRTSEEV